MVRVRFAWPKPDPQSVLAKGQMLCQDEKLKWRTPCKLQLLVTPWVESATGVPIICRKRDRVVRDPKLRQRVICADNEAIKMQRIV